tara:strand:- start:93 stop:491 length:399 start_codon:yes stop_codon:yes gene_type:complete
MLKFFTKFLIIISTSTHAFIPWSNGLSNLKSPINKNIEICPEYIEKYSKYLNTDQSEFLVKKITGILPQVDSIAGYVLHSNDVLINKILNNPMFDLETKKHWVLFFIRITQNGDNMGHQLLQWYYDLVNCLL